MKNIVFTIAAAVGIMSTLAQKQYRAGEVKTYETFTYGRFESRIKAHWALGTV